MSRAMRITKLDVFLLSLPLRHPWVTAHGEECIVDTVLLHAHTTDADAWVETCPLRYPVYSPECGLTVFHAIAEMFGPLLLGTELTNQESVGERLGQFQGNGFAKAGLDLCWWALAAVTQGKPLHAVLGGTADSIRVRATVGSGQTTAALVAAAQRAMAAGFEQIKLKIDPTFSADTLRALQRDCPGISICVDGNGAFQPIHFPLLRALDEIGVAMIEQPFHREEFGAHAELQRQVQTAVCLDESITSLNDVQRAISIQACRAISLKIGRVGGLTRALEISRFCAANGVACYVGGMLETGVGASINAELAAAIGPTAIHGIVIPSTIYEEDLVTPSLVACRGRITAASGSYLGHAVREDAVARYARKTARLSL